MVKAIESVLQEKRKFSPSEIFRSKAHIRSLNDYKIKWERSIKDPESFWGEIASDFDWFQKWNKVREYDFKGQGPALPDREANSASLRNNDNDIFIKWFEGAKTNITINCLDRHVQSGLGDRVAIIWEGNEPGDTRRITYRTLLMSVCSFAQVLKNLGVKKGDRVTIYMPMVPEIAVAMLASARLGAVHSVIFGGFSAESIADRMMDAQSNIIITADCGLRGAKKIPLKETVDEAITLCKKQNHTVDKCVVYQRTGDKIPWTEGRDFWWHDLNRQAMPVFEAEKMDAEDPLFILYTSGSTGKPKGVLHTTAGYMVYTAATFKYIFDYKPEDIFWCTADAGWITGHSYVVYGPLANAATVLMFEGIPTYPHPDRFWNICERHQVTTLYTAPTALRALMREGTDWVTKHNLSSLRLLGTVGEPINPEAWIWYYENIGSNHCPIVDTWWQTETGGILISPFPGCTDLKPGSATIPFFGVNPKILKEDGTECGVNEGGYLVITDPWPGIMRTVYGHHERFKETYFSKFPGNYYTGDGARKDNDGYYWLMGRLDDVLNVSGHRIGTAEVESALVSHPSVAEAAVVGFPHAIKGEGIYAFVTPKLDQKSTEELKKELIQHVRHVIGPIAAPDVIQFAPRLPKTRSGKIMRRILRKIAAGDIHDLGDITTLADPSIVQALVEGKA